MSALANLKLVSAKRPAQLSPIVVRRNRVSQKLWEQIQLATARKDGTSYAPTKLRTITDDNGETKTVSVPKRMKEWWFMADNGKLCLSVHYGAKTLELAKGKSAIELANADQLIPTMQLLKTAVEAGELDTQIEAVAGAARANFKK